LVGHQAIGVALDPVPFDDGLEDPQETMAIDVVAVDGHLGVPPRHDVIEGSGSEDAVRSRHAAPWINRRSSCPARSFKEFSKDVRFARRNLRRW
jgi:hypothetical protein